MTATRRTTVTRFVVLDWDGTVMDSIGAIVGCTRRAFEQVGLEAPSPERVKGVIGLGLAESMQRLYPTADEALAREALAAYSALWVDVFHHEVRPFDWTESTLDALAGRGYELAVATAKSRRGLTRDFARTGLERYFGWSRTADESGSKPDPAMLHWLMASAGHEADETVMVGDSLHDVEMAHRAGVQAVAVTSGALGRAPLEALEPAACLDGIDALAEWLEAQPTGSRIVSDG